MHYVIASIYLSFIFNYSITSNIMGSEIFIIINYSFAFVSEILYIILSKYMHILK